MSRTDDCVDRYGAAVGPRLARAVWAAVTAHPGATVRELCKHTGYRSTGLINAALRFLRDAGHITFEDRKARTVRAVIPFEVRT